MMNTSTFYNFNIDFFLGPLVSIHRQMLSKTLEKREQRQE